MSLFCIYVALEVVFLIIDLLGVLFFWNVIGILFSSVEGYMVQLTIIVLYGRLVMLGFILYSNGGGTLVITAALLIFSFLGTTYDVSIFILLAVILLLIILV